MKKIIIVIIFCIPSLCFGQSFNKHVRGFINSCSGGYNNDMGEPQLRWNLTSTEAELYVVSKYDDSQRQSWQIFNVKKVIEQNDPIDGKAYVYSLSSYKYGQGELIYVPNEKFIKVTMDSGCVFSYDIY